MAANEERRKIGRAKTHWIIQMRKCHEYKVQDDDTFYGYIEDISQEGVGVVCVDNINLGALVVCEFASDDAKEKFTPIATVVRVDKGYDMVFHYSLRFKYITERERMLLREYIEKHPHKSRTTNDYIGRECCRYS